MDSKVIKILGIDQSINCTGVCLNTIKGNKHSYRYWMIIPVSKMTKKMNAFSHPAITILNYEKLDASGYKAKYNKKSNNSDYVAKEMAKTINIYAITSCIRDIIKSTKPNIICMEGISYGSVGSASLIDLAGLNYSIRIGAMDKNVDIEIVSPTDLKKRATGNGGAEKEEMVWAWHQCDPKIKDINDIKVDDLADAFFLSQYEIK